MTLPPQPLRAALIGLSSTAVTSWAASAHLPGLLTSTGRSKIAITALLNSSVDAAKSAIQSYKLPAETKAYGTPEDLAADPDIDLAICNTRVDKHYETIIPSVRAGKDVYVEWPIAANREQIKELVETARKSGSRVAVGLQRRWSPPVLKLKDVVSNGKLGKLLSTDVRIFGGSRDREILPVGLKYFAQKEVGGNIIVIGVGHALDFVLSVVGDLDVASVHSKAQIQRPEIRIRDPKTNEIVDHITSDVPDLLSVHGTIKSSPQVAPNATLSFLARRGQPFPGTPSLAWTLDFERGEIRVTSSSTSLETGDSEEEPTTIHVHYFDSDTVETIDWGWSDRQAQLPLPARSVMESLYAFADGRAPGDGWVSLEDAAKRASLIESFLEV